MSMGCCVAIVFMVLVALAMQGIWYLFTGKPLFKPYGDEYDDRIYPFPYD
jgi:hypothetical protein